MTADNLFMNMSTAEWIVNLAFHSLLVLLMGWLFIRFLKRKSAPLRSKIIFVTMLALLLLPLFSVTYLSFDIAFYKTSLPFTGDSRLSYPQFRDTETSAVAGEHNTPSSLPDEPEASPNKLNRLGVFFQSILSRVTTAHVINGVGVLWLVGFLLLLGRLFYGATSLNGFKKGLTKIEDVRLDNILRQAQKFFRLKSLPEVYASNSAKSPVVLGIAKPLIVLPQRVYRKLSNKEIKSILFHELSHIYHKDQVTGLIQRMVTALYWWNPIVHTLSTDFSKAREEISDNHAIIGNTSREYAECLVNLAEKTALINRLPFLRGLAVPHIPLKDRITQILSKERIMATETKKSTTLIILLGFIISLGLLTGHKFTFASGQTEIKAEVIQDTVSIIQEKQEQEKEKKKKKQEQAKKGEKKEKEEEHAVEEERVKEEEQAKEEQAMEEQQMKEEEQAVEEEREKREEQVREEEQVLEEERAIQEAQEEVKKIEEKLRKLNVKVSEVKVDIEPIELQEEALSKQEERIKKKLEELKKVISEVNVNVEEIQYQRKTLSAEEKEELRKKLKELSVKIREMDNELVRKLRIDGTVDLKLAHKIKIDGSADLKLAREYRASKATDIKLARKFRVDLERDFEVDEEGKVTVKVKPVLVVKVTPKFPDEAKEKGIYGEVEVEGTTDKEGNVVSIKVLKSAHKLLDEAVIEAVKQWKYELPEYKGKPYAITFVVTVRFNPKDKDGNSWAVSIDS